MGWGGGGGEREGGIEPQMMGVAGRGGVGGGGMVGPRGDGGVEGGWKGRRPFELPCPRPASYLLKLLLPFKDLWFGAQASGFKV